MKTLIQKDICTPLFIAALFTIANLWKQPKCPLIDEWIKMWNIYIYIYTHIFIYIALPWWLSGKKSACNAWDIRSLPGSGRSWRRKWQPIPEFLPGKSHGQRSLAGYSPRGWKELDTTSWLKKNNKNIHICVCVCVYTQRERMLFSH